MRSLGWNPNPVWLMSLQEEGKTSGMCMFRGHREKAAIIKPRRETSRETKPVDTFISNFWAPEQGRNIFLLFKTPSQWYFVMVAWIESYTTLNLMLWSCVPLLKYYYSTLIRGLFSFPGRSHLRIKVWGLSRIFRNQEENI